MKKILNILLLLSFFPLVSLASMSVEHARDAKTHTNNYLAPDLSTQLTTTVDNKTLLLALQGGARDARANTTIGWRLGTNKNMGLKLTAEFLAQELPFDFYAGVLNEWVYQYAAALAYAYIPQNAHDAFIGEYELSAWASHAPSKNLTTLANGFEGFDGGITNYTDIRRIAGSNAYGLTAGLTFHPWQTLSLKVLANYDDVIYHTWFLPGEREKAIGFGSTIKLVQTIAKNYFLSVTAAYRQPFNNYQGSIAHAFYTRAGQLLLHIYSSYVRGNHGLPDSTTLGVGLDFTNGLTRNQVNPHTQTDQDVLTQWLSHPAIYMPSVLAIADEKVSTGCAPPVFSGTIPDTAVTDFSAAPFFSGANLVFSVSINTQGGPIISIQPSTGFITMTLGVGGNTTYTVTATNACGSATSNLVTATAA